jgi:hypothetical protein
MKRFSVAELQGCTGIGGKVLLYALPAWTALDQLGVRLAASLSCLAADSAVFCTQFCANRAPL